MVGSFRWPWAIRCRDGCDRMANYGGSIEFPLAIFRRVSRCVHHNADWALCPPDILRQPAA